MISDPRDETRQKLERLNAERPLRLQMADLPAATTSQPEANSSATTQTMCSICNARDSIYTCPGCSIRTCSLLCSTSHKSATGCTGQRNKSAYVPMNKYTWGTMMNDYVFLEDVGRRVGDWGKEIVKGGYVLHGYSGTGRGRSGEGRGRGKGRAGGHTKRDLLKMQLEARDIDMDILPVGMERRKLNQSYWESKCVIHYLFLSIFYNKLGFTLPSR